MEIKVGMKIVVTSLYPIDKVCSNLKIGNVGEVIKKHELDNSKFNLLDIKFGENIEFKENNNFNDDGTYSLYEDQVEIYDLDNLPISLEAFSFSMLTSEMFDRVKNNKCYGKDGKLL